MSDLLNAARQALEALEKAEEVIEDEYGGTSAFARLSCASTITALRHAIKQAQPIAWATYGSIDKLERDCLKSTVPVHSKKSSFARVPLYKTPQRLGWRALTLEEINKIASDYLEKDRSIVAWGSFADAIENELKEKNT